MTHSLEQDARAILEYAGWVEIDSDQWVHHKKNPQPEFPEKGKGPLTLRTAFWLEVQPNRITELIQGGA